MRNVFIILGLAFVLIGCTEKQRQHEKDLLRQEHTQEQRLNAQRLAAETEQMAVKTASSERTKKILINVFGSVATVAFIAGAIYGVFQVCGATVSACSEHRRDVQISQYELDNELKLRIVDKTLDPANGLSAADQASILAALPNKKVNKSLPNYST